MLSAVIGLALAIGMQPPADPRSAAEPNRTLPVSIAHIRAALDRPAPLRLTVPESKPTFRVEIRERLLYSPNLLGPVERLWSTTTGPVPPGGLLPQTLAARGCENSIKRPTRSSFGANGPTSLNRFIGVSPLEKTPLVNDDLTLATATAL